MLLHVRHLGPQPHVATISGPEGFSSTCMIGRSGILTRKREGDGGTPRGVFGLRRVFYRPDRGPPPVSTLPVHPITKNDGWCDAPAHPWYNQGVCLPFAGSHEELWRTDEVYDIIVALGHNDSPVVAGLGSAVFLHLASLDPGPTAGCVAVARRVMLRILAMAERKTALAIG